MGAGTPIYQRTWTRVRNYRTERRKRELVKKHDLSGVPIVLVHQFAQLSVRAEQLDRESFLIQKQMPCVTEMDDVTFARWCFLVTEHRRTALALTASAKSVFGEQHRAPAIDLVALMQQPVAESVESDPPESDPS